MRERRGSRERAARVKAMRERIEVFNALRQKQGWKTWHWALDESRAADNGTGVGIGPRRAWTEPSMNVESEVSTARMQSGLRKR
jgi:hypothetical protein